MLPNTLHKTKMFSISDFCNVSDLNRQLPSFPNAKLSCILTSTPHHQELVYVLPYTFNDFNKMHEINVENLGSRLIAKAQLG